VRAFGQFHIYMEQRISLCNGKPSEIPNGVFQNMHFAKTIYKCSVNTHGSERALWLRP